MRGSISALVLTATFAAWIDGATAQAPSPQQQAFRDIYRELIEIDKDIYASKDFLYRLVKQLASPGSR